MWMEDKKGGKLLRDKEKECKCVRRCNGEDETESKTSNMRERE